MALMNFTPFVVSNILHNLVFMQTFVFMTVCYYHVTYEFQNESTLYIHSIVNLQSNLRSVWLNGRVFVYELSGCGFESRCCYLNIVYII